MKNIRERIKSLRMQKKIKQSDIADKIGMKRPNYNILENRGKKLTIEQLEAIAKALDVTVKEILFDEKSTDIEKEMEYLKRENELLMREIILLKKELEFEKGGVK